MKNIIKIVLSLILLLPVTASAYTGGWSYTSTSSPAFYPTPVFGKFANVLAPYFTATSTTATSTFAGAVSFPSGIWNTLGNVGIGTTDPHTKLSIGSDSGGSATLPTNNSLWIGGVGGTSPTVPLGRLDVGFNDNPSYSTYIGSINVDYLSTVGVFGTQSGGVDYPAVYTNLGNVGIGTTTPLNKLDIAGASAIGSDYAGAYTAPPNGEIIEGNVGIGTMSPQAKLDITGGGLVVAGGVQIGGSANQPGNGRLSLAPVGNPIGNYGTLNVGITGNTYSGITIGDQTTPASTAGVYLRSNGTSPAGISTAGAPLAFFMAGPGTGEAMRILNNGNVGIGTTVPGYKLDVAGNINISAGSTYAYNGTPWSFGSTTLSNWYINGAGNFYTQSTQTGNANNGAGAAALSSVTSGYVNNAMGAYALLNNTTGYSNTAVGGQSLENVTTGYQNVGIGRLSGGTLLSGSSNTFLGNQADVSAAASTTLSNSTAIGNGAIVTQSNEVVIGNTSVSQTLLNGNIGIGTTSPGTALSVIGTTTTQGLNISNLSNTVLAVDGSGNVIATTTSSGGGGSGNSAWTIGNTFIYNATTTDAVSIGTTSSSTSLLIQAKTGINPFSIKSTNGSSTVTISSQGALCVGTLSSNCTAPQIIISNIPAPSTVVGPSSLTNGNAMNNVRATGTGNAYFSFTTDGVADRNAMGYNGSSGQFEISTGGIIGTTVQAVLNDTTLQWGFGSSTPSAKVSIEGSGKYDEFSVASSTGVVSLNVNVNGNVGISTSSPQVPLSVVGNIATASSTAPTTDYANDLVCYVDVGSAINVLGHMLDPGGVPTGTCIAN